MKVFIFNLYTVIVPSFVNEFIQFSLSEKITFVVHLLIYKLFHSFKIDKIHRDKKYFKITLGTQPTQKNTYLYKEKRLFSIFLFRIITSFTT